MNESTSTKGSNSSSLTANALEEFNNNNYGTCLQSLNKLETSVVDSKILHNKAVAEFYKSDFKKYEQFDKALSDIIGKIPEGDTIEIVDAEMIIPYYNKALIKFHLRQPQAALKIMMAVMQHIETMDESVAQKAGLLTINLLLNSHQVKKARHLFDLLELRLNLMNESFASDEEDDSELSVEQGKVIKSRDTFRWMYRLYKIRSNVLGVNVKYVVIPPQDTAELAIMRAHQHYNRIDYQMAAKELSKDFNQNTVNIEKNGEDHNTVIANNIGMVHFHVRHYAMAVRFFQHALTFDQSATESVSNKGAQPLHCIGASKRPEILYNLGIAMLHLQRPKEAFECLLVPLNYYHNNPRIWLRLAEACIMVHNHNLKGKENRNIVSSVIGSGVHRKYVIRPTPIKYVSDESQSFAIPSTNLEFASLCLRNALTLLEGHSGEFRSATDQYDDWQTIVEKSECNPSKPLTQNTFNKLKCAVLAAYSYVQICLGEYLLAFKYAKELLQLTYLPDAYAMLGRMYCAESLIMLDRIVEARAFLDPKFIAELKEDDFIHRGSPDWKINKLEAAQSIIRYNLAVTLVLQGERELASSMMGLCKHPIVFTHLKLLNMYMELQAGNLENCRIMISMDTPQYR